MSKDYTDLRITCYICLRRGHISIDCNKFKRICGNLKAYYKKFERKQGYFEEAENMNDSIEDKNTQFYDKDLVAPRSSIDFTTNNKKQSFSTNFKETATKKASKKEITTFEQ